MKANDNVTKWGFHVNGRNRGKGGMYVHSFSELYISLIYILLEGFLILEITYLSFWDWYISLGIIKSNGFHDNILLYPVAVIIFCAKLTDQ